MRRWLGLVLVVGCGNVSSETDAAPAVDAPSLDGDIDGPVEPDAAIDSTPARCNPTAAFEQPVAVAGVNSTSLDGSPFLTPDERTIYFASGRPGGMGGYDIWTATRSSPTGTFDTPSLVNGVNSAEVESRPILSGDGLTMYGEIKRGQNPYHIEQATRQSTSQAFGAFSAVPNVNSTSNDVAPYVLPDRSAMYMVSGRGGNADIWRAGTAGGGGFNTPVLATGTNLTGADGEDYPALSNDELTIFFASNRAGGLGGNDIWVATRQSVAQGFSQPVNLAAVNTAAGEVPGWISPDGCVFYFARDIGSGNLDIFVARRGM
jgi:Tol biopolymer transport system component